MAFIEVQQKLSPSKSSGDNDIDDEEARDQQLNEMYKKEHVIYIISLIVPIEMPY